MATKGRSGRDNSNKRQYDGYNGFGKYDRDHYVAFDDDEDRIVNALSKNSGGEYYDDDEEYYDEEYYEDEDEEEYYDDDEYYDEDEEEYYEDDGYEEEDYYEEEPRVRQKRSAPKRRSAQKRSAASKAPKPKKTRASKPDRPSKASNGRKGTDSKREAREDRYDEEPKKKGRFFLFAVELLVFIALIIALFIILKWSKVKKTTLTESQIFINEELKEALAEVQDEDSGGSDEWGMKGYKNVALFGVDAGGTRSDTIIIASINTKTNEVKMCSIYRDTYLNIDSMDNPNYTKANAAYAKGGPEQAIRMINMNTDMNVDDFITVDFDALEDIIDDLGGVEIDVQPEEIQYINDYQFSIVMDLGGPNEGKIKNPRNFIAVTQAGPQTLNGLQATAYCRISYTSGSDFRRTERQREVISQIVQKAKGASLSQLNKILNDVLPQITTSFTAAEFASYASRVGSYTISETRGFPFENVTGKIGKQSMVVPDTLESNVEEMHTFLFGESSYTPTTNVQTISEKVQADRTASGL